MEINYMERNNTQNEQASSQKELNIKPRMFTKATVPLGSKPWADHFSNPTFCKLNTHSRHIHFALHLPVAS